MDWKQIEGKWTVEEWLQKEIETQLCYEYISGTLLEMQGGNFRHSSINMNVLTYFNMQFRGRDCKVFGTRFRVQITPTIYLYPDGSAVCGDVICADNEQTMFANPTLIIETISPTSAYRDMGIKLDYYQVPSVECVLLVDHSRPHIRLHTKTERGWLMISYSGLDAVVPVTVFDIQLPLSEIYLDIEFDSPSSSA
ncbi:MAG: Uma2 family endonuclease [Chloroflexota bacterium]